MKLLQGIPWWSSGQATARAQVQSLVGDLRYCKPRGVAKKQTNKQTTTLYDSVRVDICHYQFVQMYRMHNTKSEL